MTVEGLCLRSERESGEAVRQILASLGILDSRRRITTEGRSILFPILRAPHRSELEALSRAGVVEVESCALPTAVKTAMSLRELLVGKVPDLVLRSIPRSYDFVGDILVVESLSPEASGFRMEIGEALLAMHAHCRSVLLKTGKVSGPYRVPQLECIAGEDRRVTVHSEYGVRMKVDLSKVYFSPRLGYERHRIASSVRDGETVVDMFAGVGPFSLIIAKRSRSDVYAIDINPEAIRLLEENILMNRLRGKIFPICGDARQVSSRIPSIADRVVMNLPGQSLEFLETATRFLKGTGGLIHIYLFSRVPPIEWATAAFSQRARQFPGCFKIINSRVVKPTAPREWIVSLDVTYEPRPYSGQLCGVRRE